MDDFYPNTKTLQNITLTGVAKSLANNSTTVIGAKKVEIQVSADVRIGGSDVTASTGLLLQTGQTYTFEKMDTLNQIYVIDVAGAIVTGIYHF
jgi:hypothetical protein